MAGLLPIKSRQEVLVPPTSGLPITSRQSGSGARNMKPSYVLETITTPVRRGRRFLGRRRLAPPATLQPPVDESNVSQLPRWTQFTGSPGGCHCDPSPVESNISSLNSSQLLALEVESNASFGFMPGVFAQSWHRKLSDAYNIVTCIGEGGTGAVFVVQHKRTRKLYACKFLRKADHDPATLRREINTLRKLDHPNVVRLVEVLEDDETVFILQECCHGGDLYEKIYENRKLDEETGRDLAKQMFQALAYCHASGVVHRDVKPENFLIEQADEDPPTLKLADFGIATSIRPAHVANSHVNHGFPCGGSGAWPSFCDENTVGSLSYMAPEVITHNWTSLQKCAGNTPELLALSDMWSAGVSLYVMLSGHLPFSGQTEEELIYQMRRPVDFSAAVWKNVSDEAIDLIKTLLSPIAEHRLSAQQALNHEWFSEQTSPNTSADEISPMLSGVQQNFVWTFLKVLRTWRALPKLRRVVITAIARQLEDQHEIRRMAQAAYSIFGESSDRLSCEGLAQTLHAALDASRPATADSGQRSVANDAIRKNFGSSACSFSNYPATPAARSATPAGTISFLAATPSPASTCAYASTASPGSASARLQGDTFSGFHVRGRLRRLVKNLSGLMEETPTATPGSSATPSECLRGGPSPDASCFSIEEGSEFVSLTELRYLVDALDGQKDGDVDYTLVLAALIPPEVYSDEGRISEVFELFDLQKRGSAGARDFCSVLLGEGTESRHWRSRPSSRIIAAKFEEFDIDGDGRLNFAEFKAMVQGQPN